MSEIYASMVKVIMCHLVGDYVLQQDFIANTKGNNWYHMFVTHIIIDPLKARYRKITYAQDQGLHYIVAALLYLI